MKTRWAIATASAAALALLTLNVPLPSFVDTAEAAEPAVCDAPAKPAKMNYTLKDIHGKAVRLSDFKGKVIVLDFWATWCGPCKQEIPGFIDLQNRYASQGLQVIGVSVDDTLDKLTPYVAQMKMNYPVLQGLGHDDIQDAYGPMFGIPTTVLITRDGKVCKKHMGMSAKEVFEKEIKSLL